MHPATFLPEDNGWLVVAGAEMTGFVCQRMGLGAARCVWVCSCKEESEFVSVPFDLCPVVPCVCCTLIIKALSAVK